MSLDEFVVELALVREENPREPDAPPEDSSNAVKIMTVHSAKGLEFPVVFVAAMHKGVDTGVPVVAFSRHLRLRRALAQSGQRQGQGRSLPARPAPGMGDSAKRRRAAACSMSP